MGICYSSASGKRNSGENGDEKADFKLKKSSSGDFVTFISKLSGGGGAAVVAEEQALSQTPGRLFSNGASRIASLYTDQQGKKGTNQDAMIVWENFCSGDDGNATFCGVCDGHGPYGHMVATKVRDALPILLRSHWESNNAENDQNHVNGNVSLEGMRRFDDFIDEDGYESVEAEEIEKVPEMHIPLKNSIRKAFKLMDELSSFD